MSLLDLAGEAVTWILEALGARSAEAGRADTEEPEEEPLDVAS